MFIVNQDRNTTINMGNVKEISLQGKGYKGVSIIKWIN